MAISKELNTTTLSIEVQSSVDKDGNPLFKKKNFSGINREATPEAIATVADAVKSVLDSETGYTFINESSILVDNA